MCKTAIIECYQTKKCEALEKLLSESDKANPITPYICLALYQKCTMLYKNTNQFNTKIGDLFRPLIDTATAGSKPLVDPQLEAPLMQPLLDNDFTNNLRVSDATWQYVDLSSLLVQIKFSAIYTRYPLIKPLRSLILNPASMLEKYVNL